MTGFALAALVAIVLFHGGAAGIRACAGRDGRLDHCSTETRGALRGMVTAMALAAPAAGLAALHASRAHTDAAIYLDAAFAFITVTGPIAATAVLAFVVSLVAPWRVRAFANTVVIGGLEFVRPLIAALGVAAVWWATQDPTVSGLAGLATASALSTHRAVAALWYSTPAALPAVTTSLEDQHAR